MKTTTQKRILTGNQRMTEPTEETRAEEETNPPQLFLKSLKLSLDLDLRVQVASHRTIDSHNYLHRIRNAFIVVVSFCQIKRQCSYDKTFNYNSIHFKYNKGSSQSCFAFLLSKVENIEDIF